MSEIGSEFWEQAPIDTEQTSGDNTACLLSGRTAIDFIIRDIKSSRSFSAVCLPSYCCESMIEPFERNYVKVEFYHADNRGIEIRDTTADAILLLDYFGFEMPENLAVAETMHKAGKIVIYDSTHKLNGYNGFSDYTFCSYRKWRYCNYAVATKKNGAFSIPRPRNTATEYCMMRNEAARLKADYIRDGKGDKDAFLTRFREAERLLENDYADFLGTPTPQDNEGIIAIRRRNAQHLIDGLQGIEAVELWRTAVCRSDIPLFVPILVSGGRRNELRDHLRERLIYCPVHWPMPRGYEIANDVYFEELSLICDQRYSLDDIDRELNAVKDFFHEV